jgi:hypothetical protein
VQNDVKDTAVGKVITTAHEYLLLEFKTLIAVVRARIRKKRMRLLDAFRAFDYNRDGMLSCSELYGGLEWLGLDLQPADIWAIMLQVDTTKEGRITWADFEKAFADDEMNLAIVLEQQAEPSTAGEVFERAVVVPKPIKELYEEAASTRRASEVREIKQEALKEIKVRSPNRGACRGPKAAKPNAILWVVGRGCALCSCIVCPGRSRARFYTRARSGLMFGTRRVVVRDTKSPSGPLVVPPPHPTPPQPAPFF